MSDTPRTDDLMGNVVGRRVALDPEYQREQKIVDLCRELERALTAKTAECERMREDATRTLWAVVFAAGGDVAVPHSLLISQDKQNILERIEYPSMTTVFKAARKETL